MKNKKLLSFILALCLVLPITLLFAGCGSAPDHIHEWQTEWRVNETSHWHACEYEFCTEKKDLGAHVYTDDHDATCNTCGYTREVEHVHAYNTQGLCDCGDYLGQEYSKNSRHFLGTREAGTYYLKYSLDVTASYTLDSNLPEDTCQFYVLRNGEWAAIGSNAFSVDTNTDNSEFFYLVVTLTEQVADIYIGVDVVS